MLTTIALVFFGVLGLGLLFLLVVQLAAIVQQLSIFNNNVVVQTTKLNNNVEQLSNNVVPISKMATSVQKRIDYYV